ncbi:hypothetical protein [Thiomicrospira sp. S5]|uniref:hypothetical protein n=1 Tax=Thiomicrospira sp. S5 TaxID=1803865 RepID=UPI000F89EF5B|nr:hypothetical protein [Thiomicrospira sp. S5]AZR80962.1 hypothetical protein AYJ59_00820 [Thiomicrospira sp. S5]
MIKAIKCGVTNFEDLHEVFKISSEELENRKAKLFPTGAPDKEGATTSIFLASLSAVKEFRQYLLSNIGANKINGKTSKLHVYTELPSEDLKTRPDGLVVITSGLRTPVIEWAAFIESKVGHKQIEQTQIDRYIDFAKDKGVENIITISNQLVPTPFDSPVTTKKKIKLFHWSWAYIKVMALYLVRNEMVEDEDHVYLLSEFRRYMDCHKNISHYTDMGEHWKEAAENIHVHDKSKKLSSNTVEKAVTSYSQEEKDLGLCLTDKSNYLIELVTKKDRYEEISDMIHADRCVTSTFMIDSNKKILLTLLLILKEEPSLAFIKLKYPKEKPEDKQQNC